uniref:Regulator of G-protein signaling 9-binding protein-like n=1 Tax=Labrus bergylta TaxID=56723 RepID=A0A3Q3EIY8_9LABR
MSRWRRSVDELAVRRRQQSECERAQEVLNRVTSCFHSLTVSTSHLSAGLSRRLVRLLSDCDSASSGDEDRQLSERLWVLFLSALETFLSDLRKPCINHLLSLYETSSCLSVSSGCIDGVVGVAARVASAQVPWLTLEEEPIPELADHIAGLETMLSEMQLRVPVAFWSVEATQPAWAEAHCELDEPDDSLEDLMEVEVVSYNKMAVCCQAPCCGLSCVG